MFFSPEIQVDLLEPVSHFLQAARESLAPENHMFSDIHKATKFFCMPLQVMNLDI
jgi:protein N-terminal methyltransferase